MGTMFWIISILMANIICGNLLLTPKVHNMSIRHRLLQNSKPFVLRKSIGPRVKYDNGLKYKRSVSICSTTTWWSCLLTLPLGIEWRLRLDVLKFVDKYVTGRKAYLEEAVIAAENARVQSEKIRLDNLKEFHNASENFRSAEANLT